MRLVERDDRAVGAGQLFGDLVRRPAVTVSVLRSCTRSRSGAMAASISGWLTHTIGRVSAIDLPGNARGDRADIAALRAVAQRPVHQHHRYHRLGDRGGADADAGSWRPVVTTSTTLPDVSSDGPGRRRLEVGFNAIEATTGWPVEMPPRMPPA